MTGREGAGGDGGVALWQRRERAVREAVGNAGEGSGLIDARRAALTVSDRLAERTVREVDRRCRIDEWTLPGAPGRRAFARVYEPEGAASPLPTQLFLHGGGFVYGTAREEVNERLLSARSVASGIRIVSYEYALAPEHPYPVARDEVVSLLAHLRAEAGRYAIDRERLGIGGVSAGGTIAASAALAWGRTSAAPLRHLSLEVPALSLDALSDADERIDTLADGGLAKEALVAQAAEYPTLRPLYLPAPDPEAFVADAPSLSGLPPTLVVMAENDLLTSGAQRFVDRVRSGGGTVRAFLRPRHVHGSPGATAISEDARSWQALVAEELRRAYGTDTRMEVDDAH